MGRLGVVCLLVVALLVQSPSGFAAAQATPGPVACTVAPRSAASLLLLAVAAVSGSAPRATDSGPNGALADAVAVAGITATVRELVACTQGGAATRAAALFSDDGLLRLVGAARGAAAGGLNVLGALPGQVRLGGGGTGVTVAVRDARTLADGRVRATVGFAAPGGLPLGVDLDAVFVRQGDGWLIDEVLSAPPATPTP